MKIHNAQYKIDNNNILNYYEAGTAKSKLLLLHAQGTNSCSFSNVIKKLAKYYHVYMVDYYGHGKSSHNPEKYNLVSIGNDIIDFINNVICDSVTLLGHSSGGLIASYIAAHSPKCIKLILEDTPFFSSCGERRYNTYNYKDYEPYRTFFKSLGCTTGSLNYVPHSKEYFSSPNKEVFDFFKENDINYPRRPLFRCNVPNQVVINYDGGWKCCDKSGFDTIASYVDDSVDEFVRKVKIFALTHRCVPTYCHDCLYVKDCMGGEVCDNFLDTGCRNISDGICRELNIKKESDVYEIKLPIEYDSKYMNEYGSCRPKIKVEE